MICYVISSGHDKQVIIVIDINWKNPYCASLAVVIGLLATHSHTSLYVFRY